VRGVTYRTFTDFSLGVRYLQLLGVQYYVAHSASASHAADTDPRLTLVATSATAAGGIAPDTWRIYRVANAPAVEPVAYQPIVVASLSASEQALCPRQVLAAGVEPNQYKRHELAGLHRCALVQRPVGDSTVPSSPTGRPAGSAPSRRSR